MDSSCRKPHTEIFRGTPTEFDFENTGSYDFDPFVLWSFLCAYNYDFEYDDEKEKTLPEVKQGQTFDNVKSSIAEHFTSPPKPYTEDTLLSAMETAGNGEYDENSDVEKKGLRTPATRASIIENLVKREFIERNKKQITATEKGANLISVLPEMVKSPKLTADWEKRLQAIEKGRETAADFMNDIEEYVKKTVADYSSKSENAALNRSRTVIAVCPKCGKNVVEFPKSYSCESGKGGCGFVVWKTISGKNISAAQAKKLIEKGKSDLIKGFTSKAGKPFDAYLYLPKDYSKVGFEFPNRK